MRYFPPDVTCPEDGEAVECIDVYDDRQVLWPCRHVFLDGSDTAEKRKRRGPPPVTYARPVST